MKKSKLSETQTIGFLREADQGVPTKEPCRKHGISEATFYNWKAKYGGLGASQLRRLKELESESSTLKTM